MFGGCRHWATTRVPRLHPSIESDTPPLEGLALIRLYTAWIHWGALAMARRQYVYSLQRRGKTTYIGKTTSPSRRQRNIDETARQAP